VKGAYHAYAPLLVMVASADEEVSPKICASFARRAKAAGWTRQQARATGLKFDNNEWGDLAG
jgi:hypothetical protein